MAMSSNLAENVNDWTEELLRGYTIKVLKSVCNVVGIAWDTFTYKTRKAPYIQALMAHHDDDDGGMSDRVVSATNPTLKKRKQRPESVASEFETAPPPRKKRKTGDDEELEQSSANASDDRESDERDESNENQDDDEDSDDKDDDDDDDEVCSNSSANSEEESQETLNDWSVSVANEQKCLQWFVDGPGALKQAPHRFQFGYQRIANFVTEYMDRRAATIRAVRIACTHLPDVIVAIIADCAVLRAVNMEKALSRKEFRSFINRNLGRLRDDEYDADIRSDDDDDDMPNTKHSDDGWGDGYGSYNGDALTHRTYLIDVNEAYAELCSEQGFQSALSASPGWWSDILQDFQSSVCTASQCQTCGMDVVPRSETQKWVFLQAKQCFGCPGCECGIIWTIDFEMVSIECRVSQRDGRIRLRSADHGQVSLLQDHEGRIQFTERQSSSPACDVLRWFAEYTLITDPAFAWRFKQYQLLKKHSCTQKTDCLEL